MAIYLYGLIRTAEARRLAERSIAGLDGTPVQAVACGELSAVVSSLERPASRVQGSLADVRAHDAVLRQVVDAGLTCVASRFGQTFPSSGDLCRHLPDAGGARVAALLRDHDGCVEMRVLIPAAPVNELSGAPDQAVGGLAKAGPGRRYLEALRAPAADPGVRLLPKLRDVIVAERPESLALGRGSVLAHLVRRESVDDYRKRVASLPELARARVVGPLALTSFAGPESGDRPA